MCVGKCAEIFSAWAGFLTSGGAANRPLVLSNTTPSRAPLVIERYVASAALLMRFEKYFTTLRRCCEMRFTAVGADLVYSGRRWENCTLCETSDRTKVVSAAASEKGNTIERWLRKVYGLKVDPTGPAHDGETARTLRHHYGVREFVGLTVHPASNSGHLMELFT
mgnify:CR=1 FL=1